MVKQKDNQTEIQGLEDIVKRDKSSQKKNRGESEKNKTHVVFYKELIPHFNVSLKVMTKMKRNLKKLGEK